MVVGTPGSWGKALFRALAGAPGGTHCLEPARTITRRMEGGRSGSGRSRAQVTVPTGAQGAPPPRLEAWRTGVLEVPLTSDAMLGGSLPSGSLGPPGLKDRAGLTTSSPPGGVPRAGPAPGWGTALGGAQPVAEADVGSAQRVRAGPLRPPLPSVPPVPPVQPVRPPSTYHRLAAQCVSPQPRGWTFLAGRASTAARRCPRLLSAAAPIPGGPARWALPPPSNPSCGRSRLRSGFGLSGPREAVGTVRVVPGRQ